MDEITFWQILCYTLVNLLCRDVGERRMGPSERRTQSRGHSASL